MTEHILTLDTAGPEFTEAVERLHREGGSATLVKDGVPLARLVPVAPARTAAEAAEAWRRRSRLDPEDAIAFAEEVERARRELPPLGEPWPE